MSEIFKHPGAVDLHDHFREPSPLNKAENFDSGTRSATTGGYVITNDMPNTPGWETWTAERAIEKGSLINLGARVPIGVVGGMQPQADNTGEIQSMDPYVSSYKQYYTRTTGNSSELTPEDFREGTEEIHRVNPNRLVMVHPGEDIEGIIGMVAIDNQQPLHFCHMNEPDEVEAVIRLVKRYDLDRVTTGLTPHHFIKTSHDVFGESWYAEMMPELVDQDKAAKLFRMLVDGDIDIIETDHAPHIDGNKMDAVKSAMDCDENPLECFGVPNIDQALPLLFYQMKMGRISAERLIEVTSTKPAEILGITLTDKTSVEWDLSHIYRIGEEPITSRPAWSPFMGKLAVGRVDSMHVGGVEIIRDHRFVGRNGRVVHSGNEF